MSIEQTRELLCDILATDDEEVPLLSLFSITQDQADEAINKLEEYNYKYGDSFIKCNPGQYTVQKHKLLAQIYKKLQKLSARDFEKLSVIICSCLGYDELLVTRQTRDGGLDFLARKHSTIYRFSHHQYIVGQSKKYRKGTVSSSEVQTLAGAALIFSRGESLQKAKKHKDWNIASHTPFGAIFITSRFFSRDAIEQCTKCSILMMDIIDIACVLVDNITNDKLKWMHNNKISLSKVKAEIKGIEEFK
jgi:restriction endonuclease Mrr